MEGIIMIISCIAGIVSAFFLGVRIGCDKGYEKGYNEMRTNLLEIYEAGNREREKIQEEIKTDCPWT